MSLFSLKKILLCMKSLQLFCKDEKLIFSVLVFDASVFFYSQCVLSDSVCYLSEGCAECLAALSLF